MSPDIHRLFHEAWLGMVQPIEGLVVSVPVLVESQCMVRHGPDMQEKFRQLCPLHDSASGRQLDEHATISGRRRRAEWQRQLIEGRRRYRDLAGFLQELLGWTPNLYDCGDQLPVELSRYISEGRQTIRPTLALRRRGEGRRRSKAPIADVETPESVAGSAYEALVWEIPSGLEFDKPETLTGDWRYPPAAKFDRLLRSCRVPIGLLSNGESVRLVYAPHGEATGSITFDLTVMGEAGGRAILDAFVTLLSADRFFGVAEQDSLPSLLSTSREWQENVTTELASQVLEALDILLRGFETAAHRDRHADLDALLETALHDRLHGTEHDHVYGGLLTVLLRLVFVLYAEEKELLPTDHAGYRSLSLTELFEELRRDNTAYPDTMSRRYGAWSRLLALFRTIYDGVSHGDFCIPARRGELFDPERYPFLESWLHPDAVEVSFTPAEPVRSEAPTIDDGTVYRVLTRLLLLNGQRISYKTLGVEQIGSVYEALMGYRVMALNSVAVCCRHKSLQSGNTGGVWIEARRLLEVKPATRTRFLVAEYDVMQADAKMISADLVDARTELALLGALERIAVNGVERRNPGQLVLQPGEERRRTSSHYTPRLLAEALVSRTLEPLLQQMSEAGELSSERLLNLKVCDPAMGSGAFLVEVCRFLADRVVAAWEREGRSDKVSSAKEDVVVHARRLVAQRCLYGVDRNPFAVGLAKLSLWLATLAKEEPFTFVDHALRYGDSLGCASVDQIRAFHWEPGPQLETISNELSVVIDEACALREQIRALAGKSSADLTRLKENILWDALDAQERARLVADLVVGLQLADGTAAERKRERNRVVQLVDSWLRDGGSPPGEIQDRRNAVRRRFPCFHWELEFPEVFRDSQGFTAICGNPPWGAPETEDERRFLKVRFEGVDSSTPDSFAYFVGLASELSPTCGYILPDSFLSKDFPRLRQRCAPLLQSVAWFENMSLPKGSQLFKGVTMDPCLITIGADEVETLDVEVHCWDAGKWKHESWRAAKADVIRPELDYVVNLRLREDDVEVWRALEQHPSLDQLVEIHEGIHSGNVRDKLFTKAPTRGDERPLFLGAKAGDHIEDFFARRSGWFVDYRKEVAIEAGGRAGLGHEEYFTRPKVYVTRTGNPFKAFVDTDTFASNNFFSVQFRVDELNTLPNLTYLAAYIRSRIAQYLVRYHLAPRMGDVFAETKIKHLKRLPFPKSPDPRSLAELVAEVERVRALKAAAFDGESTDSDQEASLLRIEELVAELLGLSGEARDYILTREHKRRTGEHKRTISKTRKKRPQTIRNAQ